MKKLLSITFAILYLVGLPAISNAQTTSGTSTKPARIYFDPSSGEVTKNSAGNIKVKVMVNTGGEDSSGADVIVEFDTNDLEFVSGTYTASSSFYPNAFQSMPSASSVNTSGRIQMARAVNAPAAGEDPDYTNGTGTFAELTFRPLISVGESTTLDFDFTLGDTEDSNVAGTDLIDNPDILGRADSATLTIAGSTPPPVGEGPEIEYIVPIEDEEEQETIIDIYGNNFGTDEGRVYLGTRLTEVISWSDDHVKIVIPRISVSGDREYQVKLRRADGEEDTYMGFKLIDVGLPLIPWVGLISLNGAAALWVKRRWFN